MFSYLLRSLSDMGTCLCFTWLSHLWSHFIGSSTNQDRASLESLPDNVVTDVLSRLPPYQVLNLRRVCKRWCSLTATDYLVQLHLERSTPVMIFQTCLPEDIIDDNITLLSVDWSSKKKKQLIRSRTIGSLPTKGYLRFSGNCNGLFIFRKISPLTYYICNPIKREVIAVTPCFIVGFFFDSLTNKYELVTLDNSKDDFEFYIGSLGPIITWSKVGSFPYRPRELFSPSVVNGCLHWMAIGKQGKEDILAPCTHSIMVFSIEDCEFRFLPHPGKVNELCQGHEKMHLLATKGHLYAYGTYAKILDIWVLEDPANWYWVKKFSIHLERDLKQYSIDDISVMGSPIYSETKLIDIWKDEVVLVVHEKGFFRYHTRLKTITEAEYAHLPFGDHTCMGMLGEANAIESTMSLMSMRDFADFSSLCRCIDKEA